ncbi:MULTISPECIES: 3'-5' exonuclease [Muribaculaceae]|jgi:DNA polymerase-3 subunit epsilon|uniref:3'-5' exonuclease n=1 Tax=Muribaculaceae TaxID=2005473 RepID=UPI000A4CB566|nr:MULTISPECIES: 3'-5' exonuclease [Muribaculaceae]
MQLNLKKPIIFFDLETTGVDVTHDRIVEISMIKVLPSGEEIEKTRRVNPGIPIPAEATAVHHITDADVANEPSFRQIAKSLANEMVGCDIAGFNSNRFDIPMLDQEFQRAGVKFDFTKARFVDVQTIFHKKEQRTLVAAYRFYCGKELDGAHSANADTRATLEVLKSQLDRYDDLPNDIEELSKFSQINRNVDFMGRLIYNDDDKEVINFGKYKGKIAEDIIRKEPSYYDWIMKSDFAQNTKDCFTRIKLRLR